MTHNNIINKKNLRILIIVLAIIVVILFITRIIMPRVKGQTNNEIYCSQAYDCKCEKEDKNCSCTYCPGTVKINPEGNGSYICSEDTKTVTCPNK